MLTGLDYVVLLLYTVGVAIFGIRAGGKQYTIEDYFVGSRRLPWWAVCFSVVATETSTLTVIGIPAVAYLGDLTFLQITFGYLVGRVLVSLYFLPRYYEGKLMTAYAFLGTRFGRKMQMTAAGTFQFTRLLADGVRLFATAIPLKVVLDMSGLSLTYWQIIILIGLVTIAYTYLGGIRAVVWMDVVQLGIYVGGALLAIGVLLSQLGLDWWSMAAEAGKTRLLYLGLDLPFSEWLTKPYTLPTALLGGAALSMASHGTDQLIVQRLLACRNVRDSQKALITSGVVVMLQFLVFLLVGLFLWVFYKGVSITELGLTRGDEIFPRFIIEGLPAGISGLVLAGIIAAAMSTLSSSLNALASSSVVDFLMPRSRRLREDGPYALRISRLATLMWGLVFMIFANLFTSQENPVIELGLSIASFTYGGLLGVFLLGLINTRVQEKAALIAFVVALVTMIWVIFGIWYGKDGNWYFTFSPSEEMVKALELRAIAWPWYTIIGTALTVGIGSGLTWLQKE